MPNDNALHTAAERGEIAKVRSQICNFDINAKGQYNETALLKAAQKGYVDVLVLLLTYHPDVNIPDVSTDVNPCTV